MATWTLGKRIDEDKGGFGIVYEVTHSDGRKGALKELKYPNAERLKRFEREIKILQKFNHSHIITVHEGNINGQQSPTALGPYYIMDYMEGGSLRKYMTNILHEQKKLFSRKWALGTIILPIIEALQYAHTHTDTTYHRDLKPANLLFTTTARNHLKVADWGLGKDVNKESIALTVGGIGTPGYCAPEQWFWFPGSTLTVDGRADIYSLGIIFYEMMTGKIPQVFNNFGQRFNIPAPSSHNHSSISTQLDNAILKMIAYEARDRHQTIQQVKDALTPIYHSMA